MGEKGLAREGCTVMKCSFRFVAFGEEELHIFFGTTPDLCFLDPSINSIL